MQKNYVINFFIQSDEAAITANLYWLTIFGSDPGSWWVILWSPQRGQPQRMVAYTPSGCCSPSGQLWSDTWLSVLDRQRNHDDWKIPQPCDLQTPAEHCNGQQQLDPSITDGTIHTHTCTSYGFMPLILHTVDPSTSLVQGHHYKAGSIVRSQPHRKVYKTTPQLLFSRNTLICP